MRFGEGARCRDIPFYLKEDQPDRKLLPIKLEFHQRVQGKGAPSYAVCQSIIRKHMQQRTKSWKRKRIDYKELERMRELYMDHFTEGNVEVSDQTQRKTRRTRNSVHRNPAFKPARTKKVKLTFTAHRAAFCLGDLKRILG